VSYYFYILTNVLTLKNWVTNIMFNVHLPVTLTLSYLWLRICSTSCNDSMEKSVIWDISKYFSDTHLRLCWFSSKNCVKMLNICVDICLQSKLDQIPINRRLTSSDIYNILLIRTEINIDYQFYVMRHVKRKIRLETNCIAKNLALSNFAG